MNKKFKIILYPLITILVFGVSALFVLQAIRFVSDKVSDIFVTNQARIEANIIKLDLEKFREVAERLNIESPMMETPERAETDETENVEETVTPPSSLE